MIQALHQLIQQQQARSRPLPLIGYCGTQGDGPQQGARQVDWASAGTQDQQEGRRTSLGRSEACLGSTATRTTGDTLNFMACRQGSAHSQGRVRCSGPELHKGETYAAQLLLKS